MVMVSSRRARRRKRDEEQLRMIYDLISLSTDANSQNEASRRNRVAN